MLVWLTAEDGSYIDELNMDAAPKVGDTVKSDRDYKVVDLPAQDENAKKFNAQVLVVKEA